MIEQKFKPNKDILKLKNVEINIGGDDRKYAEHYDDINRVIPKVYYYNAEILDSDILTLEVDSSDFLMNCYITFNDTQNIMNDIGFPTDNATVTILLPSGHPVLANIFLEFKIVEFDVDSIENSSAKRYSIYGILNVENLLIKEYKSYNKKTSFDILSDISKQSGLGFMTNIATSNDKMNWFNPGERNINFINYVIKHAWINDNSFVTAFIDFYYNINYINIEQSLSDDININWVAQNRVDNETPTDELIKPMLSNNQSLQQNNNYFSGENIINKSTSISLNRGYIRNVHFYDFDGNWKNKAGSYKVYGLDTITSSKNGDNKIVLKGDGKSDFYNKNKNYIYAGVLDTKNAHPDYLWAKVQNGENNYDLNKISIEITLPNPNFNLRRYEKVQLVYTKSNVSARGNMGPIKLNGEWLITGIKFKRIGQSPLYQVVTLIKRELSIGEV